MSLFGDVVKGVGAVGAAPLTGGASLALFPGINKRPGAQAPYQMKPLADPSQIKTDPALMSILGAQGQKQQNDINSLYSRIRGNFNADANARGVAPGEYGAGRIDTAQDLSGQGLNNTLQAVLGNTAYQDFQGERGYAQQDSLAREIASLSKPTTLEQILGGLSGAANVGGSLYGAFGGRSPRPGSTGPISSSLSMYDPYSSGYERYR